MSHQTHVENPHIILIGSGIMSANLGALLKQLDPRLTVQVYEAAPGLAQESSHGWNNAGTGHAGLCELSYTPRREPDGRVSVQKLVEIFGQFELSRQFWAHAAASGMLPQVRDCLNPVPHLSFVHGREMVDFLRDRYEGMRAHHFFRGIRYSMDPGEIATWAPLLVEGRGDVPIAATCMLNGTDINFGAIARQLIHWLSTQEGCGVATSHRVTGLERDGDRWKITVRDELTGTHRTSRAAFVFVGAGGGSLPLLQKAALPEARGLGGFPIGGQWLICENPDLVSRHHAKVYGQPLDAAPTMAVPHLDTRFLDGRKTLLFGPFAKWTTRFLHQGGRCTDLPLSIKPDNLLTLLNIGLHNLDLVRYLVQQGLQSMEDRMEVLRVFYPAARAEDWRLIDAGIRVQAIKKTDGKAGIVHYGTEVITSADGSLSALLGASPGASVSVSIVLEVVKKCFPALLREPASLARLSAMMPTWDLDAARPEHAARFREISERVDATLGLVTPE